MSEQLGDRASRYRAGKDKRRQKEACGEALESARDSCWMSKGRHQMELDIRVWSSKERL